MSFHFLYIQNDYRRGSSDNCMGMKRRVLGHSGEERDVVIGCRRQWQNGGRRCVAFPETLLGRCYAA